MILRVFIKKFLFHEIKAVLRPLSKFLLIHTHNLCILHMRTAFAQQLVSISEEHHSQETITKKIKYRAAECSMVAYRNRNPREGA